LVFVAVALVVVVGAGLVIRYAFVTSPDEAATRAAPRISDPSFERAASAVCKRYVTLFNTETTLGQLPSAAQSGAFLQSIASSFDQLVRELRSLPVAPADQANVALWLSEWDRYDAYGHQYARAVASGAEGPLTKDKSAIDGLLRQRNGFARANHLGACAFS
jgi:hypothetical protein